jgi:acyl-CoA synthetase (AMP-forming)/AMP-acid ligase II
VPPEGLAGWLAAIVHGQPERPALFTDEQTWSYRQLWARSESVAQALLRDPAFRSGCRVGLVGRNSAEYLAVFLGVIRAGAVVVPLNDRLAPHELAGQLEFVEAIGCVVGDVGAGIREGLNGTVPLWTAAELDSVALRSLPLTDPTADAIVLVTSGSTGAPKGVRHSQATLLHAATQLAIGFPISRDDVSIASLPFFASIPEQVLPTLVSGGALDVLSRFDIDAICDACGRATWFDSVPTIMARLLDEGDHDKLNRLRWVAFASEPMPPSLLQRWWDALPAVETHQFYGMTEVLPITHASHRSTGDDAATVGFPFPTSAVTLYTDTGDPAMPGEQGEIACQSPAGMLGYLNDDVATLAAIHPSGAIRTGDLGVFDDSGRLYLTGRKKDIIISGGLNIAPVEIEAIACTHPRVAMAAAVGIPDDRWGETPIIIAVLKSGNSLTPAELLTHCRSQLTGFKRPSGAAIVQSFPVTGIGKSAKPLLRDAIIRGELSVVRAT